VKLFDAFADIRIPKNCLHTYIHTYHTKHQGFRSASISCGSGSGSRVLKTDPDPDPRPEFLRVKKYLKNVHFFSSIFTNMKKIENVLKSLCFLSEKVKKWFLL